MARLSAFSARAALSVIVLVLIVIVVIVLVVVLVLAMYYYVKRVVIVIGPEKRSDTFGLWSFSSAAA